MNSEAALKGLIEKSVTGDAGSFRTLVEHLDGKLFGYVRSRTNTREDALDTLQDVLVDVWKALKTFEYCTDAGFYRFVFTIAKRHLYRVYRKPHTTSLEDVEDISGQGLVDTVEDSDALARALGTLDATARDIVTLKHWSGFSFGEIGTLLAMKEDAVRVRHHRALEKMRNILETHD